MYFNKNIQIYIINEEVGTILQLCLSKDQKMLLNAIDAILSVRIVIM